MGARRWKIRPASRVAGKVGYTIGPGRPPRAISRRPMATAIGIAAASKNKEAAYLLCQWWFREDRARACCKPAVACRSRTSIVDDPEVAKGVKTKEWLQSVIDSSKISKLGLPVIIPVAEFRDIVGAALDRDAVGRRSGHRAKEGA